MDLDYKDSGYVGSYLKDALTISEPIHLVRLQVGGKGGHTKISFYSRGDFRSDIVEQAQLISEDYEYDLPSGWKEKILGSGEKRLKVGSNRGDVEFGALDFKRLALIARSGWTNPENRRMDDEGNQVLSREDLSIEFRGAIVDQVLNDSRFGKASEIMLPPSDGELEKMSEEAGRIFDKYQSIPVGSLIATRYWNSRYSIGRKNFNQLRWKSPKYCRYSEEGIMIPTADPAIHFTGIETKFAPHIFRNPVFLSLFNFPLYFTLDSLVVEKDKESGYVSNLISSMGKFNSIFVQGIPSNVPSEIIPARLRGRDWSPSRGEFEKAVEYILKIN